MAKLLNISSVAGGGPSYNLTVDNSSGVVPNDHVSDSDGNLFRVTGVPDSTHLDVEDDVPPDAPEGVPAVGDGAAYTPTGAAKLSQLPSASPAWGEVLRRDMRAIDNAVKGFQGTHGTPVANVTALAALGAVDRSDRMMRLVEDGGTYGASEGVLYSYDEQSTAVDTDPGPPFLDDTDGVIIPNDQPAAGRWIALWKQGVHHQALSDLQGGTATQRYHLSSAEHAALTAISGLASGAPGNVDKSAAVAGVSTSAAREDHKHDVSTAAPALSLSATGANTEGVAATLARSDHLHDLNTGGGTSTIGASGSQGEGVSSSIARADHAHPVNTASGTLSTINAGDTAVGGTSDGIARKDHQHPVSSGAAVGIAATSVNAEGTSTDLARSDHTHDIDTTGGVISTIQAGDTAVEGVGSGVSRRDHQHAISTAAPQSVGGANSEGVSSSFSRSDHMHAHGSQGGASEHLAATIISNGFMSSSDKTKLDAINDASNEKLANKNQIGGYAGLDGSSKLSGAQQTYGSSANTAVEGNDSRIPTQGENDALAGTGVPSALNPYVSDDDARLTDDRAANALRNSTGVVSISASAAPTIGQSLVATSPTVATWQGVAVLGVTAPLNVDTGGASAGASGEASRVDHKHDIDTAGGTISTIEAGDAASEGTGTGVSRRDHQHAVKVDAAVGGGAIASIEAGDAAVEGTGTAVSRRDHQHAVSTAAASELSASTANGEGVATSLARSDHTHGIDTTGGVISTIQAGDAAGEGVGTGISRRDHQHAVSTGGGTAGVAPNNAAGAGTSANLAREDHTHTLASASAGAIQPDDVAAVGIANSVSRSDHKHSIVTAASSQGIGGGNSEGVADSFSRSDHDHTIRESGGQDLTVGAVSDGQLLSRTGAAVVGQSAITDSQHGTRAGGTQHAAATGVVDGFMSAADKSKLDSLATGIGATASVSSSTPANITSTVDILVPGMTITPSAGIYLVHSTCAARTAVANTTSWSSVWTNGTPTAQIAHTQREMFGGSGTPGNLTSVSRVTVDGATAIEMRARVSAGDNFDVEGRFLSVTKVGE